MLAIFLLSAVLFLYFQKSICSNYKVFQSLRWLLFTLLLGMEITYQIWTATHGVWIHNLPFHLCGVAGLIGAAALLTLNRKLIAVSFFIGLIPAFMALLTPDLRYDFPNFRYFTFFIQHIALSLTSIFFAITSKPNTINFRSMLLTFGCLVLYGIFVTLVINPWLQANYLYLEGPPPISSPLDFIGEGLLYRLNLHGLALLVFYLQYVAYRFYQKKYFTNDFHEKTKAAQPSR